MKRQRRVLAGLAAIFLVELAIGIPAALRRDAADDARATPRPVTTIPSTRVVAHARPFVHRRVAVAKLSPRPVHTVAATAKPATTVTPAATAVPTVAARPAANVKLAALQGVWQIDEANLQVGTMVWYADAVLSSSGTLVLNANKESIAGRSAVPCERQTDLHAALALGVSQQTVPFREVNCEGATSSGELRVGSFSPDDRSFSGSFWRRGAKLGDFDARKI